MYHFSPSEFSLRQLRQGDFRGCLSQAAGGEPTVASAPVTLVYSAIFWRSAWKYRARGYRYCFWDNGTIIANLLAASAAARLPGRIIAGFVDAQVDRLVGIDGRQEASFCLAAIGQPDGSPAEPSTPEVPLLSEHEPLSFADQIDYPGNQRRPCCGAADHRGGGGGLARAIDLGPASSPSRCGTLWRGRSPKAHNQPAWEK